MDKLNKTEFQKLIIPYSHRLMLYKLVSDVTNVLTRHKLDYFIDGGTLLGAIRHQDLIPWDDDIDIGMLDKDFFRKLPKLKPEFEKLGYSVDETDTHLTKVYIKNKWIYDDFKTVGTPTLDIFCYTIKKKTVRLMKTRHYLLWKSAQHKVNDVFPLKDYKFGPLLLKGPKNPFPYLDGLYSNWKTSAVIEMRNKDNEKSETLILKIDELFDYIHKNQILNIHIEK